MSPVHFPSYVVFLDLLARLEFPVRHEWPWVLSRKVTRLSSLAADVLKIRVKFSSLTFFVSLGYLTRGVLQPKLYKLLFASRPSPCRVVHGRFVDLYGCAEEKCKKKQTNDGHVPIPGHFWIRSYRIIYTS